MGRTGARTLGAVSRGIFGIGDALMQIGARKDDREAQAAEAAARAEQMKYARGRDTLADTRYDTDRRMDLEAQGYAINDPNETSLGRAMMQASNATGVAQPSYTVGERDPMRSHAVQNSEATAKVEETARLSGLVSTSETLARMLAKGQPLPAGWRSSSDDADPFKDPLYQERAEFDARQKITELGQDGALKWAQGNPGKYGQMTQTAVLRLGNDAAKADTRGPTGGTPGIDKLPADQQRAVANAGPALASLDAYEQAAKSYLARSPMNRALGNMRVPNADRDAAIGQIQSMQRAVLVNIKELAGLGVLAGPDMEIVEDMIGDPTAVGSLTRDPEYTLSRIREARQFLNDRIGGIEKAYGVTVPRPAGSGGGDLDSQIKAVDAEHPEWSDEQVAAEAQRRMGS